METTKKELIFDGNEKRVYATSDPGTVVFHFKDVATAFNNVKTAVFPRKGIVNNKISALIFDYLGKNGIYTHYISTINDREQLCRKSENIPLEVVVRNYIAGSLSDRLGIEEGTKPSTVIYDLNYNNSDLGDPLINDTQAVALGIVSFEDLKYIYAVAAKVNDLLLSLFTPLGIKLVDFKLEFGRDTNGKIMLVDEISPDTSRFWDAATDKRLDKDRFRHDMGYIVASYEEVLNRLLSVQESQQ
ncbi:MAG TPA: phosphoribosylaminoimidazolesuccinocarboxamide synthase [Rikenellaceae bacterium]|nr:phosphoribosylaminoimidazolesuccinocarboxamide synthase [Rikenellaceae bacterium]